MNRKYIIFPWKYWRALACLCAYGLPQYFYISSIYIVFLLSQKLTKTTENPENLTINKKKKILTTLYNCTARKIATTYNLTKWLIVMKWKAIRNKHRSVHYGKAIEISFSWAQSPSRLTASRICSYKFAALLPTYLLCPTNKHV